ncbi:MAG: lactate racemase domain-containing protein [Caldilineaceae bacterium]|nr:lactate racemase domain-containing protein [Caldilineaceae bacterium]
MIQLAPVRQSVSEQQVENVSAAVWNGLNAVALSERVRPGMRVAVAVGSRGISCYREVVQAVVETLKSLGAEPFLVPAMGSHGGGTAEGQHAVLVGYGMADLGVPIHSSLEVKQIAEAAGMPVYWDRHAAEADAVIPVNRVKAHTAFRADHESGLCKILTIGLGKRKGAATLHAHDAVTAIPRAAQVILKTMPVVAGVAIVENGRHEPAEIAVLAGERIFEEEPALLRKAKALQPSIPFDDLDLLIVQEMGKNISGTGMDTNIIGMWRRNGGPREPNFRVLAVLDLTAGSHGNASGVGLADLIPERLRAKIDWHATYTNCLTAGNFAAAKQPVVLPSDREVIETGLMGKDAGSARVVWIRNTLELDTLWLSPALLAEAREIPALTDVGSLQFVGFTADGALQPPATEQIVS